MSWTNLDQLARDANTGDPAAVQRLRDAASAVMDPFPLLEIIDRYPTGEETTEIFAKRVIELDEINERAWQALASVYDLYDGQWLNERTRIAVERLLSINSNNIEGLRICLFHAHLCGDDERQQEMIRRILAVEPLHFGASMALAKSIAAKGDKAAAISAVDRYVERMRESTLDDKDELIRLAITRRAQIETNALHEGPWP